MKRTRSKWQIWSWPLPHGCHWEHQMYLHPNQPIKWLYCRNMLSRHYWRKINFFFFLSTRTCILHTINQRHFMMDVSGHRTAPYSTSWTRLDNWQTDNPTTTTNSIHMVPIWLALDTWFACWLTLALSSCWFYNLNWIDNLDRSFKFQIIFP